MKFEVDNIGKLKYVLAIIFGSNKVVKTFCAGGDDEPDIRRFEDGRMIVTISKDVLIITELIDGKRKPILVRKWKQKPRLKVPFADFLPDGIEYEDSKGNNWLYLINRGKSPSLNLHHKSGEKTTIIFK